jgi:hypothetical protein
MDSEDYMLLDYAGGYESGNYDDDYEDHIYGI